MVSIIHVFRAWEPDRLHVCKKYPIEEETVVPVDEKPDAVAECQGRPEVIGSCEFHQAKHQQKCKKKGKAFLNKYRFREELRRHTLVGLEILLLNIPWIVVTCC